MCGELQWSVGSGFDHAVVGYNSHGDYFYNTPGSGYENIADIVSCSFQVSNRRRRMIVLNDVTGQTQHYCIATPAAVCFCNIQNERNSISDMQIQQILENLPDCAPNSQLVEVDHLFEPDPTKAACFRSKIQVVPENIGIDTVQKSYLFVQRCCYDPDG